MKKIIKVGDKEIGDGKPVFIIAEAGVNHDGDVEKAKKLIDVAVEANADAVKFQTFTGEKLASKDAFLATYHKKGAKTGESLKQLLKRLELTFDEHKILFDYAKKKGIMCFSTPFDEQSVDFLVKSGVPAIKVSSFHVTHLPLLAYISKKKLPIILSTGLSTFQEVKDAVNTIYNAGNKELILLQCVSNYPIEPKDANLRVMHTLEKEFNIPIGYSDHTMGFEVSLAAVAMGAKVIEKHFTLDPYAPGVDHIASLGPKELKEMISQIRNVESAFGSSVKKVVGIEKEIRRVHRVSIVSKVHISKGEKITEDMLAIKKPGIGIPPKSIGLVVGKEAKRDIGADRIIKLSDLK